MRAIFFLLLLLGGRPERRPDRRRSAAARHRGRTRPGIEVLDRLDLLTPLIYWVEWPSYDGGTAYIYGKGFGEKDPAPPLLFADFENGIDPSPLGLKTAWDDIQNMEWSAGEGFNGSGGAAGRPENRIWTMQVDSLDQPWTGEGPMLDGQRSYVYRKISQNFTATNPSQNWKNWRMWPGPGAGGYPNIYASPSHGRGYVEGEPCPCDSGPCRETGFWQPFPVETMRWMTQELIVKASSGPDLRDGTLGFRSFWEDGYQLVQGEIMTRPPCPDPSRLMHTNYVVHGVAENLGMWNPAWSWTNQTWADDVYVDLTWARVLLGDASTYEASQRLEIQIPSAWSEEYVSVTARTADFAPGTVLYLYVFDRFGEPNAEGYPIVVGGGGAPGVPGRNGPAILRGGLAAAFGDVSQVLQPRRMHDLALPNVLPPAAPVVPVCDTGVLRARTAGPTVSQFPAQRAMHPRLPDGHFAQPFGDLGELLTNRPALEFSPVFWPETGVF